MRRASISEAKNRLSALIDRARRGETILIEDRGVPVVKLESVLSTPDLASEGRLARLERQGVIRRPAAAPPLELLIEQAPRLERGTTLSEAILEERENGR